MDELVVVPDADERRARLTCIFPSSGSSLKRPTTLEERLVRDVAQKAAGRERSIRIESLV